jgi:threonine dehydratase
VDGAGGKSVLDTMWPLLHEYVHESFVVSLDDAAKAMKLVAERARVIAEGAAACAVAAAVSPAMASRGHKNVVAVVSGGNVDLKKFAQLVGACS